MTDSAKKDHALEIVRKLTAQGHTAYYAGGCVRDLIMKAEPHDIDVATNASPDQVEKYFPKTVPVGKQFGVVLVLIEGVPFEVATFRREGGYADGRHPSWVEPTVPEEDAKRRDFTINGLFFDPVKQSVIDFVGGTKDIEARVIRTIGNPEERFEEDKLRLIRAVRFASTLGFSIEAKTFETIRRMAAQIRIVSPERVRDELVKMFTRANAGRALDLLSETGLLKVILPEIEAMKGCEQDKTHHPEGDVFIHTKLLMDKLKDPTPTLAFGALLHDVGKPRTFSNEGGRIHFYEHEHIGAKMAEDIMTRLRFSNKEIEMVVASVANHMRFMHVKEMREGKLKNFLARTTMPEEMELHRIDCLSSHGKLDNYEFLQEKLKHYKEEDLKPKPFIRGDDLIALGLKPGPLMGQVIVEAYELQLDGKFASRDEAIVWASHRIKPLL